MMRTLIALLASAAIGLPSAAQQMDTGQGSRQHQGSRPKAQTVEREGAGSPRAMNREQDRRGGHMDRAGRMTSREYGKGEHELRGRTGSYEGSRGNRVRGSTVYEEDRGPRYSYTGGRRVYSRVCPRYIYLDGRRVFNERCARSSYLGGRYYREREREPRNSYIGERRVYSTSEYGSRRGGMYSSRRTAVREYGRERGGERGRIMSERREATPREGSSRAGAQAQPSHSQDSGAQRSAHNRPRGQRETGPQPGAR